MKFALALGKEYPDARAVKKSVAPGNVEKVNQIFVNNIYGSAGVIGHAHHSNVVLNVQQGDFGSLKQTLSEKGVSPADIRELKQALDAEEAPKPGGFGPLVSAWIGKMMQKAADGSWKIGTDVAGSLIGKALSKYYGLH